MLQPLRRGAGAAAGPGPARLLVVNAPPLTEPVVVNGPFVMNTASQIQDAYAEFRANTFAVPGR